MRRYLVSKRRDSG
jgi:hypothetical protein